MLGAKTHLSDEEILLFYDQELRTQHASAARAHIAQCDACRARLAALENASAEFLMLHEQEIRAQSYRSPSSRNVLKARLREASNSVVTSLRFKFVSVLSRQLAGVSLAVLIVAGSAWAVRYFVHMRSRFDSTPIEVIALPRRTLTPGSARTVTVAELCSSQDLENDPPVDTSVKQAVFREYGVPNSSEKNYQLDYLITPALGGVDSIQNLWPQPDSSNWNSRVKDQLEDHLHALVCQGKVKLATAQNDIASDWIEAYKRYFNTDQPQPGLAVGSKQNLSRDPRNKSLSSVSAADDLALIATYKQ